MKINKVNKYNNIYIFELDQNNYLKFCPERGGVITNWVSDGEEILYFDEKGLLCFIKIVPVSYKKIFIFLRKGL